MHLKKIEIEGFKSFSKKTKLSFESSITGIVGPNGSGKSNVAEAFRFVLGEQSIKTLRGKRGEDLIFNGGTGASRANFAKVKIFFDNSSKKIDNHFKEVSISRSVFKDGVNEYKINDTKVRHKDIIELLAKANIGATGHHIISQGEADRILNASMVERKEMIEDGLGLKALQFRKKESVKKLNKVEEHIKEIDIRLREMKPHINFLEKRIEKYKRVKEIKKELIELYKEYIAKEIKYIKDNKDVMQTRYDSLIIKSEENKKNIKQLQEKTKESNKEDIYKRIKEKRNSLKLVQEDREVIILKIAKLEGEINAKKLINDENKKTSIPFIKLSNIYQKYSKIDLKLANLEHTLNELLHSIKELLNYENEEETIHIDTTEIENKLNLNQKEVLAIDEKIKTIEREVAELENSQKEIIEETGNERLFNLLKDQNDLDKEINKLEYSLKTIIGDEVRLKDELREGEALIGAEIFNYKEFSAFVEEERYLQKERMRELEKKKIMLETIGTDDGEEVFEEYEKLKKDYDFTEKEKNDMLESIEDCNKIIDELNTQIEKRFNSGIKLVSEQFDLFFKILFGGGVASVLAKEEKVLNRDDEEEIKMGVSIKISLPRKKIHSLDQLSGGERALISIALLFAISQITPPPFLILDETDAALDESNSKKYGDMIEELATKSQLILVTHNRETMYRAGVLYGVTMNQVGISNILSIKFEEAVAVAK